MDAVARDETGMFLGASALVVEGITSLEVAEAMACREDLLSQAIWTCRRSELPRTVSMW